MLAKTAVTKEYWSGLMQEVKNNQRNDCRVVKLQDCRGRPHFCCRLQELQRVLHICSCSLNSLCVQQVTNDWEQVNPLCCTQWEEMNAIWVKTVERTEELSDQITGKLAKKRAEENSAARSNQMKSRQRLSLLYLSVSESFYICQ